MREVSFFPLAKGETRRGFVALGNSPFSLDGRRSSVYNLQSKVSFSAPQLGNSVPNPFAKAVSVGMLYSCKSLLTLEGGKVVEPPGDTVLSIGRPNDFDPCALLDMAHARQSDPESLLKLVSPAPGHIGR